MSWSKLVRGF